MSKLLNKPFKAFTIYALVILACSIPVYYLTVDFIWLHELDEHNLIIKKRIEKRFATIHFEQELTTILEAWNTLQPGTKLTPSKSFMPKSNRVYTVTKENEYTEGYDIDRFRGLSAYIPINGKPYHLTIETNVEEANETMLAIAVVTFLFFFILVVGFIFLNRRIAKGVWQPFRNTLEKLKAFDLSSGKSLLLEKTNIEEFAELNQTLQKLIDRNISAYNQQKTFIENASHELQTPLAVLKSKMDLLLQNKDLSSGQSKILNAIQLPLARVSRINKNLLLLAKIENSQFAETENLNLSTVLDESTELLVDYIEDKKLCLDHQVTQAFFISCNKFLLETLLNNLLINAIRHTPKNGSVNLEFADRTLFFKNTGTEPLQKQKLFERFAVSASGTTNSGLGLAIVKEICHRYQWQVDYTFSDNLHSFSVQF